MAAKSSRPGRLESLIENYRGDGNWPRVLDLSRQLSAKTPHLGSCQNICVLVYNRNVNVALQILGHSQVLSSWLVLSGTTILQRK